MSGYSRGKWDFDSTRVASAALSPTARSATAVVSPNAIFRMMSYG